MSAAQQITQADNRPWFKIFLEQNGISENMKVQVRTAYFDRLKKRPENSCQRVEIELKDVKRIRTVLINGQKLYRVFLHKKGGSDVFSRFPEERSLHGNGVLSFLDGATLKAPEQLTSPVLLHDKKDSNVKHSGINENNELLKERTVRNITDKATQQSIFHSNPSVKRKNQATQKASGRHLKKPIESSFLTFEDITKKLLYEGSYF